MNIVFYIDYHKNKVGAAPSPAPTLTLYRVNRSTGTESSAGVSGAAMTASSLAGRYFYQLTGADLQTYDYHGRATTSDTTVDDREPPVLWTRYSEAVVTDANGKVTVGTNSDKTGYSTLAATGIVSAPFGPRYDEADASCTDTDGNIYLAGYMLDSTGNIGQIAVAKFRPDGSVDNSFGTGGYALVPSLNADLFDHGYGVAVQTDGKVVVCGSSTFGGFTGTKFVVVRLNANGSLDTDFATSGVFTLTELGTAGSANDVAIQGDGKILAAGNGTIVGGSAGDFVVVRLTTAGALDNTWGSGGIAATNITAGGSHANCLAIQSDGMVLVGGQAHIGQNYFALLRYTTAGVLDSGFGTGGITASSSIGPNHAAIVGLAIQSDGKIVAGGYSGTSNRVFTLIRYTSVGAVDTGYGTSGVITTSIGTDAPLNRLGVQANDKVVAFGAANSGPGATFVMAAARYTTVGVLDSTFGTAGIATVAIGDDAAATGGLVVRRYPATADRMLLAGYGNSLGRYSFTLVALKNDGTLDTDSFGYPPGTAWGYGPSADLLAGRLTAARATKLDNLDVSVNSRLATSSYTAPDNASIATAASAAASAATAASNAASSSSTAAANTTSILARLGGFAGSGINTVLGFLRALLRGDSAITPSDVGGTYDNTTMSMETQSARQTAIKTKTDSLTYTVPNKLDANTKAVNDVPVQGTGASGDEWRPG